MQTYAGFSVSDLTGHHFLCFELFKTESLCIKPVSHSSSLNVKIVQFDQLLNELSFLKQALAFPSSKHI